MRYALNMKLAVGLFGLFLVMVFGIGCGIMLNTDNKKTPPPAPAPVKGNLVGSWHSGARLSGKAYEWIYTFSSNGAFQDEDTNTDDSSTTGGVGTYTHSAGKVAIEWTSSSTRENASISWITPDKFRYVITSHTDPKQVGLEVEFVRMDPHKPRDLKKELPTTITKMTAGRIERLVQSLPDTEHFEELDNDTYRFDVNGLNIMLDNKGETMQLAAIFNGDTTVSRINEWNRSKRFSRAYLNTEGEPVLEADIDLRGGVLEENVKEWVRIFVLSLETFKAHLEE